MNFLINISQIAIITGDNPYKSKREYLIEYWEKYDKNDYLKFKNKTNFIKETDNDVINNISSKNNINIKEELNKCSNSNNINDFQNNKKELLNKIELLPENEKKEITKSINNVTNTNFGTNNENDIFKIYENMSGLQFIKDNIYRKYRIIDTIDICVFIGGKIDGINKEKDTIIEIKNRVNKLFYSLREYEKVQIMCYMHIFNIKKSHLVEAFKKKFNAEINIIEVKYDESYMNNIICKIYNFCLFFKNFMTDNELKIKILNSTNEINF